MEQRKSPPRRLAFGIVVALGVLASGLLLLPGLDDFDLSEYHQQTISFETNSARLSGTLVQPGRDHKGPIVLLVHGDGPQDRFSSGGYLPLMSALLDKGIGVYSWDKPGVGDSTRNWLEQSMQDRSDEALAAYAAVKQSTARNSNPIGFMGLSQAGWVLPNVARQIPPDTVLVIVGGATNWRRQGAYFATRRLQAEGRDEDFVRDSTRRRQAYHEEIFHPSADYDSYLAHPATRRPMSEERFRFAARNYRSDSTEDLTRISNPTLAVFGAEDLNVDAACEAEIYERSLAENHPDNRILLWPKATHGLARARWFNYQLESQWPWYARASAFAAGRYLFAPGVMDEIATWIRQSAQVGPPIEQPVKLARATPSPAVEAKITEGRARAVQRISKIIIRRQPICSDNANSRAIRVTVTLPLRLLL